MRYLKLIHRLWQKFVLISLLYALSGYYSCQAIILMGTGDPQANTSAPTGELLNSGWQWVGKWGKTSGVAIAQKYFITVQHVGGNLLDPFVFHGVSYTGVRFHNDPETDLRIVLIAGNLPQFAPLHTGSDELGKRAVVIGRGTDRGEPLYTSLGAQLILKGWRWGAANSILRWGENRVSGILRNLDGGVETLMLRFDKTGGPNEAHVSPGDSGGGLFLQDGLGWKLGGLINTTEGFYSLGPVGPSISAAVFDQGGLYKGGNPTWELIEDTSIDQPGRFFCIRVSTRMDWIRSVIGSSSTSATPPTLQSSFSARGPFVDRTDAAVDPVAKVFSLPVRNAEEFYRLKGEGRILIRTIQVRENSVWMAYD